MARKLDSLINTLQQASSLSDLHDAVYRVREIYDVDDVVYHAANRSKEPFLALTYENNWVEQYLEADYVRIDPVVQGSIARFQPFDWKELDWSGKTARNFLHEAVASGVGNQGMSVPIRGPSGQFALFTVSASKTDDQWEKFSHDSMSDLILLSHYFNQSALRLTGSQTAAPSKPLSPREVDALSLLAAGQSRGHAAEKLGISEHTLRVYIEAARLKLGANNTTHAVALGLAQGLIIL